MPARARRPPAPATDSAAAADQRGIDTRRSGDARMRRSLCIAVLAAAAALLPAAARADSASLLAQAQAADPSRYAFALAKGTEIRNTADNRSFTMWLRPSAAVPPKGVIVPLHGHDGYATEGIALWQPYAEKYGYAI